MDIIDNQTKHNNTRLKRNSCLLITLVILVLLIAFAYVASKEVSNAFQLVDKGLSESNKSTTASNRVLRNALSKTAEYEPIIKQIETESIKFNSLIDSTINQLIYRTGGWKEGSDKTEFANPKNYEIPTQILISEKVGEKIKKAIQQTNQQYKRILMEELGVDTISIPLKLNTNFKENNNKTWAKRNFDQMPLFALMPILRKLKNDETESKAIIYKYMANK